MVISLNNNTGTEFHQDENRRKIYTVFVIIIVLVLGLVGWFYYVAKNDGIIGGKSKEEILAEQLAFLSTLQATSTPTTSIEQQEKELKKLSVKVSTSSPPGDMKDGKTKEQARVLDSLKAN